MEAIGLSMQYKRVFYSAQISVLGTITLPNTVIPPGSTNIPIQSALSYSGKIDLGRRWPILDDGNGGIFENISAGEQTSISGIVTVETTILTSTSGTATLKFAPFYINNQKYEIESFPISWTRPGTSSDNVSIYYSDISSQSRLTLDNYQIGRVLNNNQGITQVGSELLETTISTYSGVKISGIGLTQDLTVRTRINITSPIPSQAREVVTSPMGLETGPPQFGPSPVRTEITAPMPVNNKKILTPPDTVVRALDVVKDAENQAQDLTIGPDQPAPSPPAQSIPAPTPPPPPAAAKKAPTPVTTQTRNTVSTSRTATSARSVPSAAPAKPAAGNLTRQQYNAAVANLARINQDLAAAQNQLNTLYRNRNPRNAAQIKALGTTIARLKSQAASAKQTVDRLKKSI